MREGEQKRDFRCQSCRKLLFRGDALKNFIEVKCRFCHLINQFSPGTLLDDPPAPCLHVSSEAQLLSLALAALQDHIIITDEHGIILYANKAVTEKTGFSLAEVIGKNPGDLWGGHMPKEFYEKLWHTIKTEKKPFVDQVRNKTKNGEDIVDELRITPVLNEAGDVQFFLGIELDVTERERRQRGIGFGDRPSISGTTHRHSLAARYVA